MTESSSSRKSMLNSETEKAISVVCRIRPLSSKELREGGENVVIVGDDKASCDLSGSEKYHFDYDAVVGPDSSQEDVYNVAAKPVVEDYLEGFNGTIFAYGQTGAGKTYTMEGVVEDAEKRGLLPRMVCAIFDYMERSGEHMQFMIQVQYLEIYNEKIRDLLAPDKDNLKVREDKTGGIYVEGATSLYITTETEVQQILEVGASSRATAETYMNQASSRSHSIFVITLEQTNTLDQSRKKSKLFMVDLAGSEMVRKTGAEGATLKEAQHINKSLSALSNVIFALSEGKASHIPYRDSKLTRILQEAIGGNCRTALIINCSPAKSNESETISTMRFGKSAKRIKNKAHINKEQSPAELKMLLAEMQRKNRELQDIISAKDDEIETLKQYGGGEGSESGEAARRMVEVKEEMLKEKEAREAAEEKLRDMEAKIQELESEKEDALEEKQSEIEQLQSSIAQKEAELEDATRSLRDLATADVSKSALPAGVLEQCLQELEKLRAQATEGSEEGASQLTKAVQEFSELLSKNFKQEDDASKEKAEQISKDEHHILMEKYSELLESKLENADDFAKKRVLQLEKSNDVLLKRAKEDSKMLEGRDLEIAIWEKKLLQKTQRVQILEMLLQDSRNKFEQQKKQLAKYWGQDGHNGEGNRRINTHKPIQGGRQVQRGLQQMQEGLMNNDDISQQTNKVREFIKKVQGSPH